MNKDAIEKINIVLVETTHPGNIGATARAMKTMGMTNLRLVSPKIFPSAEATARATGADDILASAKIYETLEEAIQDCRLVFATSARIRSIAWPVSTPEQAAERIVEQAQTDSETAVVFGRESSGLSNEELECCHAMTQIPANPGFSSLNLASAVQIICYEIRKMLLNNQEDSPEEVEKPASVEQMGMLYEHLEETLTHIGYLDPANPRLLMRRLKRLFNRAQLDLNEYNILRGILAAVQDRTGEKRN